MAITILLFGQLTEITGCDRLSLPGVKDTNDLVNLLNEEYPAMKAIKYRVAVDKKMITGNVQITEQNSIALMPPFSGG